MIIRISTPARIHLTLIDLSSDSYRKNGGIGFAIDKKNVTIEVQKSESTDITVLESMLPRSKITKQLAISINNAIVRYKLSSSIKIKYAFIGHQNSGLGSGTSLALAVLESLFIVNGINVTNQELVTLSNRGGASGVGINTYFNGGFIFDLGIRNSNSHFSSSEDFTSVAVRPLLASRLNMPMWEMAFFLPHDLKSVSSEAEKNIFSTQLPIPVHETYKQTYHSVMGTFASVADNDYFNFCKSINAIQSCRWKSIEIEAHQPRILDYYSFFINDLQCDAVALSSLGPGLVIIDKNIKEKYDNIVNNHPGSLLYLTRPNNTGRIIENA